MYRAIGIIKREIEQRESANMDKKNLRYQLIKLEIESLNKVLEMVENYKDIHSVSECDPAIHNAAIAWGHKCGKCGSSKQIDYGY